MDPQERTCHFPIIYSVALRKPPGHAREVCIAGNIVIYPWIWGRQPAAKVLLTLVTYEVVSVYMLVNGNIERLQTFQLVCPNHQFLHQDWRTS